MIGEKVRMERERRGWSQSELARRAKLTPQAVSLIEQGKRMTPGAETLLALATALGTTIDQLVDPDAGAGLPPEVAALQAEGIPDESLRELNRLWGDLSPEDRETALAVARSLWERTRTKQGKQTRRPVQPTQG
jgi:transcriptional regulator with XRE-family HTH domain